MFFSPIFFSLFLSFCLPPLSFGHFSFILYHFSLCFLLFFCLFLQIRYPSLYEYAFLESHGWIELIKKFSPNRLYAMPKRTLGKKSALKYNDQTGVIFDFSELSSLISYTKEKRKKSSSSLFPSATPEQVALAKMIADAYRCTRKRLTTRQMTCLVVGGDESHRIVQTLQTSDSFPSQLYPCPWEDCPKQVWIFFFFFKKENSRVFFFFFF